MQKAHSPQPIIPPTAGIRRYLYFTSAVTGAAVLIVEILGAKMLAPWLGTSHFVWTAQIAVTLLALAAGYLIGGEAADRSPKLDRLYICVALAGLFLCLGVSISQPVASACLKFSLPVATLLSSLILYFLPLTFLAMTVPFLTRVLTKTASNVGGQVGRLSAVSTLGSVGGTVLISYLLIPFLPNSITMYGTAIALFIVVLGYFILIRRKAVLAFCFIAAGLIIGLPGVYRVRSFQNAHELYFHNSSFGQMQVVELKSSSRRFYLNDFLVQNTYNAEQKQSLSMFTYMLHGLAHAYRTNINEVLCLGLGVGIVPMRFANEGVRVDVVEINSEVVPLGQKFFDLHPEKLNLTIGDARYFLNQTRSKYDAVILDAFLGDASPSHLMSREAFASIRNVLRPEGVLVINSFGDFTPGKDFLTASLNKTLHAVFPSVRIHAAGNGNVFFVASDVTSLNLGVRPDESQLPVQVHDLVLDAFDNSPTTDPQSGIVLTDDYNPVDFYDAANREQNRRRLALSISEL